VERRETGEITKFTMGKYPLRNVNFVKYYAMKMDESGQFHDPAALSPGKSPQYLLDRRLGGTQRRSERGGEEKNSLPPPRDRTPVIQPVA
jgi:hypothetical protein